MARPQHGEHRGHIVERAARVFQKLWGASKGGGKKGSGRRRGEQVGVGEGAMDMVDEGFLVGVLGSYRKE